MAGCLKRGQVCHAFKGDGAGGAAAAGGDPFGDRLGERRRGNAVLGACDGLGGDADAGELVPDVEAGEGLAGAQDSVAPPSFAEAIAEGITAGGGGTASAVTLEGVAHLAPFEAPGHVAGLLRTLITWAESRGAGE